MIMFKERFQRIRKVKLATTYGVQNVNFRKLY